jgi:hypothetical protein
MVNGRIVKWLVAPVLCAGACAYDELDEGTLQEEVAGANVPLCHYDGQGRVRLIVVDEAAVPAHVANHGDHAPLTFFVDADGDGFGDDAATVEGCEAPTGTVDVAGDCNDTDAAINPDAAEVCGDNTDNDCDGALATPPPVQFLEGIPQQRDAPQGVCTTHQDVTFTVCRESPDQQVVVSSDAAGTGAAYFDEVGVLTVTTPGGITSGANYRFWEANCNDVAFPDIFVGTAPQLLDVTSLFGAEVGDFTVQLRVRNAFQPYQWLTTWVVPLP